MQFTGKIDNFFEQLAFRPQLDKIDIAVNHRLRHTFEIGHTNVTEIENTVEAAIGYISQSFYSWSRTGGGFSSKASELIIRSTKPVSYLPSRNAPLRMIAA